jgi:hypothetical protein
MANRKASFAKITATVAVAKRAALDEWYRREPLLRGVRVRAFDDIVYISCVAVAAVMLCDSAAAQDEHLNRIAKAAQDTSIAGYIRTNAACEGIDPPTLYLDEPPEHGVVCWNSADIRIRWVIESNMGHCVGRIARGVAIRYLSRRDYAGPDDLRYTVRFTQVNHSVGITVTVRPSGPESSRKQSLDVDTMEPDRPQSPGPMPRCVLLMS